MSVAMMQVGKMRMRMGHGFMAMGVGVGLSRWIVRPMRMMMMVVMDMTMVVLERFVRMVMLVRLREMKIEPDRHQQTGDRQAKG